MALPEDFSKIYGSTATGGLTPINDVNYAKGWEFVGANPPTKNDFSYLQNLSDLKSQWLYSNKLQRTDPFGDIKSDGAAAISTALENLGLKTAALRDVGAGANQIPDMSSFLSSIGASSGYQQLPGGLTIQFGTSAIPANGSTTITLPKAAQSGIIFYMVTFNGSQGGTPDSVWISATTLTTITLNHYGDNGSITGNWIVLSN